MKLITFLENHSVNYALINGYMTMFLIAAIAFIILQYLRIKEAKSALKKELFFNKVSAETIEGYEHQIKLQEIQIEETKTLLKQKVIFIEDIRKSFTNSCDQLKELAIQKEDAIAEITELRSMYNERQERIKVLGEQITYWKERALHQKHTKKVVESELWECLTSLQYDYFEIGKIYKESNVERKIDGMIFLHGEDSDKIPYLVEKKYFKPVQK